MASAYLINKVRGIFGTMRPGTEIDNASRVGVQVVSAGGLLIPATNSTVAAAAARARALLAGGGTDDEAAQIMSSALEAALGGAETAEFASGLKADTISELTAAAGITLDGVLLKDGKLFGQNVTSLQLASGTFVAGTVTVATGITVTADTVAIPILTTLPTGSTNIGGIAHIKASNVAGGPGTGSVTLNVITDAGVLDSDAAGDVAFLLVN